MVGMRAEQIRNFSIIAHIDHGKSTLADRLMEITGTLTGREKVDQFLDKMEIERERGITIKAQTVRMNHRGKDGREYVFNLIDTPGHVDFSYEVSRSLCACEGAILVVDASQGVEAQTLANVYMALAQNLEIIPVLNKIDLPNAEPDRVRQEIEDVIGLDTKGMIAVSAKKGTGVEEILEAVVRLVPPPSGDENAPTKALIVDSWFDNYQGVVILARIFDGRLAVGQKISLMSTGRTFEIQKVGVFSPHPKEVESLGPGEVGFVIANIKDLNETKVGDTITDAKRPAAVPLPGFQVTRPMVFAGLYPVISDNFGQLRTAIEKLRLNDSSFTAEPETSVALGFGFRCGFLGLLHMEIVQERLEREYGVELITTAPTVGYRAICRDGSVTEVDSPARLPDPLALDHIEEPIILATIHLPSEHLGAIIKLCEERRGLQRQMKFLSSNRVILEYELPLNEIVLDFYDKLKTASRGYASMDYDLHEFRRSDLVKLDILINGEKVDALSLIVHRDQAYFKGRDVAERLRKLIPRQLFEVVIQAAIGSKVIARETVRAISKNVIAKCYGGDITRKRKLLEKQKEGKKRMKQVGTVEIPQEAFLSILKVKE
ncbi:MAG TPA: translation elongation factor 4 [Candidatus Deferrimicrobiaceae bacterium]|nr:translation elongation factor 4 [Candidatus Deferrimicrobiaceae bacterium]